MYNKVVLIGRLGADPKVGYTQSETAVANFNIATTESWVNDGEKSEKTEWHRIVAWGRLGEVCGKYLVKGKLVLIEGKIQTRSWEDRDGNKRYTTEIVAREMKMLGSAGENNSNETENVPPAQQSELSPDDVPF